MSSFSLSGGVQVIGFISPTDTNDTYPVIDPLYGIDGFRNVNTLTELNSIPALRRRAGMVVGVSGGTTYYKLNPSPWNFTTSDWSVFSSGGGASGDYLPLSGGTVTGGTVFNLGLTANTISATTYLNLPIDLTITGISYSNNTLTITNNSGNTLSTQINSFTGLTINGIISATTISGGTLFGDGSNLTGISTQDTFVTGGTYSNGTATFTNNTGGTFNVLGFYTGETSYVNSLTTGTGLSGNSTTGNITLVNTAPDQVVTLTEGNNIDVQGTYPNFTIAVTGLTDNNRFVTGFTYNNANTFTISDNSGSTYSATFNTVTGLTVNGNLVVTGTTLVNTLTGTSAVLSGSAQNILTIIGSGSTQPLVSVQGSFGELFTIYDNLIGSLFSVNDISGLPILEVFSDNTILMGSYVAPSLNTTTRVTAGVGTTNIYSIPTSAYTGAFFDYTVSDGTNLRAGNIMSIWSGSSVNFTETSTTDFGSTTGLTFNVVVSGGNAILQTSGVTGSWTVKTIVRSI
jgi:hypothetical protein